MPILSNPVAGGGGISPVRPGMLNNQSGTPDVTLGRLGLPYAMPRTGSPEAARMPYGAGVGPTRTGTGAVEGGEGTVARMLAKAMTPQPTGPIAPSAGTPPPAIMSQQVAPVGPVVRPAPPVTPSPLSGAAPQPAASPTAAPTPTGQPAGGATGVAKATAPASAPATAPAPMPLGSAGSGEGGAGGISPWFNATPVAGAGSLPWWMPETGSGAGSGGSTDKSNTEIDVNAPERSYG